MPVVVGSFAGFSPAVACSHPLSASSSESLISLERVNERDLGSS